MCSAVFVEHPLLVAGVLLCFCSLGASLRVRLCCSRLGARRELLGAVWLVMSLDFSAVFPRVAQLPEGACLAEWELVGACVGDDAEMVGRWRRWPPAPRGAQLREGGGVAGLP